MKFKRLFNFFKSKIDPNIRSMFVSTLVTALFCLASLIDETRMIENRLLAYFLIAKTLPLFCFFILLLEILKKKDINYLGSIFIFIAYAYVIMSSFFRPYYIIGMFDVTIIYLFIFQPPKKYFWYAAVTGFSIFSILQILRYPNIPELTAVGTLSDQLFLSLQRFLVIGFIFYFFYQRKNAELEKEKKYSQLGRQAGRIAHDLKGTITTPLLLIDSLKYDNSSKNIEELSKNLEVVSIQLNHIYDSLMEFSRFTVSDQMPASIFLMSESIHSIKNLLFRNFKNARLEIIGDLKVNCDRALITSLFSNLIQNSINAANNSRISNLIFKVEVIDTESHIEVNFCDNCGGFKPEALSHISSGLAYSSNGSGVGVSIIRNVAKDLKGEVFFENFNLGARVNLKFKKPNPFFVVG